jgi:hypothetical protein
VPEHTLYLRFVEEPLRAADSSAGDDGRSASFAPAAAARVPIIPALPPPLHLAFFVRGAVPGGASAAAGDIPLCGTDNRRVYHGRVIREGG